MSSARDLSPRETRALLLRYHLHGDRRARDQLVEGWLPLADRLARRYYRNREPLEDLRQVAYLGLVKAVDGFDVARLNSFRSYAVPTILGELRRHFRDTAWALHVPRGLQERALAVDKAIEDTAGREGKAPRISEVAEATGMTVEEALEALAATRARDADSLDAPVAAADDGETTRMEVTGSEDAGYDRVECAISISQGMHVLSEREHLVMHLRFQHDMTQSEIAKRIGVSQMQVSRIIRSSLDRLRSVADPEPASEPAPLRGGSRALSA
jgi:RNA polymerase sigma-B factor